MRLQKVIFLMLSTASVLTRIAFANIKTEDQLNVESSTSKEEAMVASSAQNFPDDITLVAIKDEGNENDPDTGLGMVIQKYSIGQTEVTARQYCYYLNQVATGENYQLFYNEKMGTDPNVASIKREIVHGKNQYSVIQDRNGNRGDFPIVYVSLYQAARFCNWLQNKNTPGLTGEALTERGAYTLDGSKSSAPLARNPEATWFIPNENEWYKAAYYKGGGLNTGYWHFANRTDWAPSHSFAKGANNANYYVASYTKQGPPYLTPVNYFKDSFGTYNTYDMSGNVAEWIAEEEDQGAFPLKYIARGGSWKSLYYGASFVNKLDVADWGLELSKWSRHAYDPTQGYDNVGFRVATSLLVSSPPPTKVAPKKEALTPTEVIEAPLAILTGLGMVFSGKKMLDWRHNTDAKKAEQERENLRVSQNMTKRIMTESPCTEDEFFKRLDLTPDFSTSPKNLDQSDTKKWSVVSSPSSIATEIAKEGIEEDVRKIDSLFEAAKGKYQTYKTLVSNDGVYNQNSFIKSASVERLLSPTQEMCDAYDLYAAGVKAAADKIKELFPNEYQLWVPWHQASITAGIEAAVLRHAVAKEYYRYGVFDALGRSVKEQVINLRKQSNEKVAAQLEQLTEYQRNIKLLEEEGRLGRKDEIVSDLFQKITSEIAALQIIKEKIDNRESEISGLVMSEVNGAYSDYIKSKGLLQHSNWNSLFYNIASQQNTSAELINVVAAAQLQQQVQEFLKRGSIECEASDIEYDKAYNPSGAVNTVNAPPVNQRFNHESRQKGYSIKGHIIPIDLEHKFREEDQKKNVEAITPEGFIEVPQNLR